MANRGSPQQSKAKPREWVFHTPPRCPGCQLTYRPPHAVKPHKEQEQGGEAPDGKPYTHVSWRMCRCHHCDRQFVVRVLENRGDGTSG